MPGKKWDNRQRDPDNPMPTSKFEAFYTDPALQRFAYSTARRYGKNEEDVQDREIVGWEAVWLASGGTEIAQVRKAIAGRIESYYRTVELAERQNDGDPGKSYNQNLNFYGISPPDAGKV